MGKLTLKLVFSIGLLTIFLASFLLYQIYSSSHEQVREMVEQQASMALKFDLAIRSYVSEHIRPAMWELLGPEEFRKETMSTSFIARSIFEDVRDQYPDYIIKFSAANPRNPLNQAGKEELELIQYFNANPTIEQWQGELEINDKPYMGIFNARRMAHSCLPCHGDPTDAPASLIEEYGDTAGFHQPMGKVIGLDMVAIPMTRFSSLLRKNSYSEVIIAAFAIFAFFLTTTILIRFLMINRLNRIAEHLRNAYSDIKGTSIPYMDIHGDDEISEIAESFNLLHKELHKSYASLERLVDERTKELHEKNERLKLKKEKLSSFFRATPAGIGMVQDRIFTEANERLCSMLGYNADELIGCSTRIMYLNQEEFERTGQIYEQVAKHGIGTVETQWQRKDGQLIDVLLSLAPLEPNDLSKGVTFTALDITAQNEAARAKKSLEKMLARSKKMEALGLLAGGVAHDLNNVLSGIVSYPDLLLLELPEESPLRKPLITIQDSGRKAEAIVQDLLTMARRGVTSTTVIDLNILLQEYLESPEHAAIMKHYPEITVQVRFSPVSCNIEGSSVHIKTAIMNLFSNAAEAIGEDGQIETTIFNRFLEAPLKGYDDIKKGDYFGLRIKDTGSGISNEDINHIFEPFYTKKVMGKSGTGLGMSVVWGTVQDHNGYITVDSSPGEGTTFELYFPATEKLPDNEETNLDIEQYTGNGEYILVVDDNEKQREIACALLHRLGYKTNAVAGGEEALVFLEKTAVDLVILDMIMDPGMDGLETYMRIIEKFPDQKAIIASGFSETDRLKEAQRLGAGEYVKKPYSLEQIGLAVKRAL